LGDDNEFSGQYAQRRHRKGNGYYVPPTYGTPKNFFFRPYWPSQPPSESRDAQQAKLTYAVSLWQGLTSEQKAVYNAIAIKKGRRGYNYFISQTINSL